MVGSWFIKDWAAYQERVATFFRTIGLPAETNVRLPGVRATHAIDVVVRHRVIGLDQTWIVECKFWNRPISQQPVLALQKIVEDVGAHRGFLLSEKGFRRGAADAARESNVTLARLAELSELAEQDFLQRVADPPYRTATYTDEGYGGAVFDLRLLRVDGSPVRLPVSCVLVHPNGPQWTYDLKPEDVDEDGVAEIGLYSFDFGPPSGVTYRVVWRTPEGPIVTSGWIHPEK